MLVNMKLSNTVVIFSVKARDRVSDVNQSFLDGRDKPRTVFTASLTSSWNVGHRSCSSSDNVEKRLYTSTA